MGLFDFFSGNRSEKYEQKGDDYFSKNLYGYAKIEIEKALNTLDKQSIGADSREKQLQKKLTQCKEALASDHIKTSKELKEIGSLQEAKDILLLAKELTENRELHQEIDTLLNETTPIQEESTPEEYYGLDSEDSNEEEADKPVDHEEYFLALCGSLPEQEQTAYQNYGEDFQKGYVALNQGDFEVALSMLSTAYENDASEKSFIPLELATAYLNTGNTEDAGPLIEEFLSEYPGSIKACSMMCEIFWEKEEFDQSLEFLKSFPQDPLYPSFIPLLQGKAFALSGRYQEAEDVYRGYLESNDPDENIMLSLAKTYEALGKTEKARDIYSELIQACQGCGQRIDPILKQQYADTSFKIGDHSTQVLEVYLSLCQEISENRAGNYRKVSEIYTSQGNEEEAQRFQDFAKRAAEE